MIQRICNYCKELIDQPFYKYDLYKMGIDGIYKNSNRKKHADVCYKCHKVFNLEESMIDDI